MSDKELKEKLSELEAKLFNLGHLAIECRRWDITILLEAAKRILTECPRRDEE
jgi:hypothetical protein